MKRNVLRAGMAAVVPSLNVAAPVATGRFEDGIAAYRRGDYPTAMGLLRPLADQGERPSSTQSPVHVAKWPWCAADPYGCDWLVSQGRVLHKPARAAMTSIGRNICALT